MIIGMVGLGRMGGNMVKRLLRVGHQVVAYDQSPAAVRASEAEGASGVASLEELVRELSPPRTVWVMVPPGEATETTIQSLARLLSPGDTVIDGGNNNYKGSMRRAEELRAQGIHFLDVGTSGGIWGLEGGYSLMVGGDPGVFRRVETIFQALAPAPDTGYGHVGPSGSGHFTKMVHNGVEYALLQAYAEGFELLKAKEEFALDLPKIAQVWRFGSVVRSFLLDLVASALEQNPEMEGVKAYVEDTGEGRWTVAESVDLGVPIPAITLSLQARFRSRQDRPFGARLLNVLRNLFGGHAVRKA